MSLIEVNSEEKMCIPNMFAMRRLKQQFLKQQREIADTSCLLLKSTMKKKCV